MDLAEDELVIMGMEGSANKVGVGIVTSSGRVLSNPRKTFITPPGEGFQVCVAFSLFFFPCVAQRSWGVVPKPRETARHHQEHVLPMVHQALADAGIPWRRVNAIAFTKGPGEC